MYAVQQWYTGGHISNNKTCNEWPKEESHYVNKKIVIVRYIFWLSIHFLS